MAQPFTLQSAFMGMRQDESRDLLPGNALWDCVDWIPQFLGSPLRKRGGWFYQSPAIGAYVDGIVHAPFAAGEKFVAVGVDGPGTTASLYWYTTGANTVVGTWVTGGLGSATYQNPIYATTTVGGAPVGTVIAFPSDRTTLPKSWDGTTYGTLAGTPPAAAYGSIWNSRVIMANGTALGVLQPQRLWYGPVGNAAGTWDTTNAWSDTQAPVTGVAVLKTAILLFHQKYTERIRGTTPPSATGIGDLVQDNVFQVGCVDAKTIVNYNDTVIWADVRGVYQSDGAAIKDLTGTGGMRAYWRQLLYNYTTSYHLAAGVINDTLIITVGANAGLTQDVLCYDLTRNFWYRMSNFPAKCFARVSNLYEELHMGMMFGTPAGRIAGLSSLFQPSALSRRDGDTSGLPVAPYFETGIFRGYTHFHRRWVPSMGLQDWKNIFLSYYMDDLNSENPYLTISSGNDSRSVFFSSSRTLPVSATIGLPGPYTRARRDIGKSGNGLIIRVAQTGASHDTRISGFDAEYSPREGSRLVQ